MEGTIRKAKTKCVGNPVWWKHLFIFEEQFIRDKAVSDNKNQLRQTHVIFTALQMYWASHCFDFTMF